MGIAWAGHNSTKSFPPLVSYVKLFEVDEKVGALNPTGSRGKTKVLIK